MAGHWDDGKDALAVFAVALKEETAEGALALTVAEEPEAGGNGGALKVFCLEPRSENAFGKGNLAHFEAGPIFLGAFRPEGLDERAEFPLLGIEHIKGVAGIARLAEFPAVAVVLADETGHGGGFIHRHAPLVEVHDGEFEDLLDAGDAGEDCVAAGAANGGQDFRGDPFAERLGFGFAGFKDERVETGFGDAECHLLAADGVGNADAIPFIFVERLHGIAVVGNVQGAADIGGYKPRLPGTIQSAHGRALEVESLELIFCFCHFFSSCWELSRGGKFLGFTSLFGIACDEELDVAGKAALLLFAAFAGDFE